MPARLSPRNRAKRGAKTAGAQSEDVPLFTRRRTGGEWVEVATLPHHQQAMPRNRAKRGAKTAGAQSEDVPLFTRRRTGGEWVEIATLPHHQQAIAAQSREARCKNSRSAERGCSSVHPPPNRRRMGGGSNLAPPPTGYRRTIARSAVQKTAGAQSAAPAGAFRSATAAGGTWRGDRMFLCSPAAEQAANGWRR